MIQKAFKGKNSLILYAHKLVLNFHFSITGNDYSLVKIFRNCVNI